MPIDAEIKEILNGHDEVLKEHNERLHNLEIEFAKTNTTLDYLKESHDELKQDFKSLENVVISNNNTMLGSINNISTILIAKENNQVQKDITKDNIQSQEKINKFTNLNNLIKQILITGGTVLCALLAGDMLLK